jgi:O-antigen/teichoic acid export membrane protein
MSDVVNKIKRLTGFGQGHERTNRAKKNIFASLFIKGMSILIGLVLVPLTINYVNPTRYGIWLTLSSIIGWFGFFDIGFGNGLRNKFAEALAKGEKELARIYVSTTYAILTIIIGIVFVLFLIVNPLLNWVKILNTTPDMGRELSILALIVFTFFCLQFILQLITTILTADQKPAKASSFNLLGSTFSLCTIFIITKTTTGSLLYLGLALGFAPILVLSASSLWFYTHEYKFYAPSFKYVRFSYARNLMNLGIKFFFIQIATVFLYQTNNLIITQLFGPKEVTTYNIAFKYFSIIPMAFTIITTPFWSAYTEAYFKKDLQWIRRTIGSLVKIWMLFFLASVIMLVFSNMVYRLWIGNTIKVPFILSIVCALYGIVITWSNIFLSFINGIGKITIQLYLTGIVMVLNIPLAVYLAKYLHFGISGVLLSTCLNFMLFALIIPIQYRRIMTNTAVGVWNK